MHTGPSVQLLANNLKPSTSTRPLELGFHPGPEKMSRATKGGRFTGGISRISKIYLNSLGISRKRSDSPMFSRVWGSLSSLESLDSLESLENGLF